MTPAGPGVFRRMRTSEAQRLTLAAVLVAWDLVAAEPKKQKPPRNLRAEVQAEFPPAARRLARDA